MIIQGITTNKKSKKAGRINEQLGLHNSILQKIKTRVLFLLASAANMLGTSRIPIGCMIWQHAGFLESICETKSIINLLTAERTGFLTPLLTCSTLLFFSLLIERIIPSPNHYVLFTLGQIGLSPILLRSSPLWTKIFSYRIPSSLCSSRSKKSKSSSNLHKNRLSQYGFLS